MSYQKTCPDCGKKFWTTNGYRYCAGCHRQRRRSLRRGDYLSPLPRYRPPVRRDERGVFQ